MAWPVRDRAVHWFALEGGAAPEPDSGGVHRSRAFAGRALAVEAMLVEDLAKGPETLRRSMDDDDRRRFIERLAARPGRAIPGSA